MYKPSSPPKEELDTVELLRYLMDELNSVQAEFSRVSQGRVEDAIGEPVRSRDGQLVYADGLGWNPNSLAPGYFMRLSGAWRKVMTLDEAGEYNGDLTVTGDLYVNGGTLGIGTDAVAGWSNAASDGQIQFGARGALSAVSGGITVSLGNNAYYSAAWKYITANAASLFNLNQSGNFYWYYAAAGAVGGTITFSEKMSLIGSTGYLGIGTTPAVRLHVLENSSNGTIREVGLFDTDTQSTTVSGSGAILGFRGSGDGYFGAVGGYGNGTVTGMGLWSATKSGAPALYVTSGNVGIGLSGTAAAGRLDVKASDYSHMVLTPNSGSNKAFINKDTTDFFIDLNRDTATGTFGNTSAVHARMRMSAGNGAGYISFAVSNSNNTTATDVFKINGDGTIQYGTFVAAVTAVQGYIALKDSGGTTRKVAILT